MNPLYLSCAVVSCYANDNSAFVPQLWANEGLAILEENMVMGGLVHRDFEPVVANFGETVHTRRPGSFKVRRKTDTTSLTQQDASAVNVPVVLNQWFYTSFTIKDGEASKSFKDLVQVYLLPGMQTIARGVDRALLGHVHKFLSGPTGRAGRLRNMTSSNAKDYVLAARERLNVNKAHETDRRLVVSPSSETSMLQTDLFLKANERGDGGSALENARLGRILGFDTFMAQNVNSVSTGLTVASGTVTSALAAEGTGSQAVTITGYQVNVGEYAVVAGNDQPTFITAATVGGGDTTAVTMNEANKFATLASAAITVYKKCDVNGNYAAGYSEGIVVDGWTTAPQVGQLISFSTSTTRRTYTVIESDLTGSGEQTIYLDRPLELGLSNNDLAFPGPAGSFNMAFHRDALAFVNRPLALPSPGTGVMSSVGVYNNVSMRVSAQYNINAGGTIVNLDMLAGIAVLDTNLMVALLG
jgi:hypothetical protein